jgi:CheY-like chemotaxis protein
VPRRRVLVIDDEPSLLALAAAVLGERYAVETRGTCEGAFDAIARERPDVVLVDCLFAGRPEGWALASRLRQDPRTPGVGVILFTADRAFVRANTHLLERYAIRVVAKPFELDALLDAVAAAELVSGELGAAAG